MEPYSYDIVLEVDKTSIPTPNTFTVTDGITAIALAPTHSGLVYTVVNPLVDNTLSANFLGSTYLIDEAYHDSEFQMATTTGYLTFTFLSSDLTPSAGSFTVTNLLPNQRLTLPVSPISEFGGVSAVLLSANCNGIAFDTVTPLASSTVVATFLGSQFKIDKAYTGSTFALLTNYGYTLVPFVSSDLVPPLSSMTVTSAVDTSETRRLRYLGFR